IAAALGVALIVALIPAVLYLRRAPADATAMRFEISIPGLVGNGVMISPDGKQVAFFVQSPEGERSASVRAIGGEKAQPIPGTERINNMFWSPDSRYLGFIADGKLKKVDISGGAVQTICDLTGSSQN